MNSKLKLTQHISAHNNHEHESHSWVLRDGNSYSPLIDILKAAGKWKSSNIFQTIAVVLCLLEKKREEKSTEF